MLKGKKCDEAKRYHLKHDSVRIAQIGVNSILFRVVGQWGQRVWKKWRPDNSAPTYDKLVNLILGSDPQIVKWRKELYGGKATYSIPSLFQDVEAIHELAMRLAAGDGEFDDDFIVEPSLAEDDEMSDDDDELSGEGDDELFLG